MKYAKPDAMVMHCLPAHRGEEITEDVFEEHAKEIFDEAEKQASRPEGRYGKTFKVIA